MDGPHARPAPVSPSVPAIDRLGALVDRVFPRGALILSILSLGYFATGWSATASSPRTFGVGAELDAYNAAFRIPEIALDVLVARRAHGAVRADLQRPPPARRARPPTTFARTVLTVAVLAIVRRHRRPVRRRAVARRARRRRLRPADPRAVRRARSGSMCVTPVLFAASIALGEVLVAHQRFLVLRPGADPLHGGDRRRDGPVRAILGIQARPGAPSAGAVGPSRGPDGRAAPDAASGSGRGSAIRTPAFREFFRLMLPRMVSHPIDPLIADLLHRSSPRRSGSGRSARSTSPSDYQVVPVSLIGVSFSLAVFPTLAAAYAAGDGGDVPADPRPEPRDDRRPDGRWPRSRSRSSPTRSSRCSSAAARSARTTSTGRRPS